MAAPRRHPAHGKRAPGSRPAFRAVAALVLFGLLVWPGGTRLAAQAPKPDGPKGASKPASGLPPLGSQPGTMPPGSGPGLPAPQPGGSSFSGQPGGFGPPAGFSGTTFGGGPPGGGSFGSGMVTLSEKVPRFQFKIDPKTPIDALLPAPPQVRAGAPLLTDDLARVPEVQFQLPTPKGLEPQKALEQNAPTVPKLTHVNARQTDAFMEALTGKRPDLAGLPRGRGDACRSSAGRARHFNAAVAAVRGAMQGGNGFGKGGSGGRGGGG